VTNLQDRPHPRQVKERQYETGSRRVFDRRPGTGRPLNEQKKVLTLIFELNDENLINICTYNISIYISFTVLVIGKEITKSRNLQH
jgi:hypothetical protein